MKKFNIPIFKLSFGIKSKIKFLVGALDILTSNRPLGESKYVKKFEDKFAKMSNVNYAIACSNGTTALELSLKSVGVQNKKVLIPSNTFFATSVAVTNSGGIIELLDIDLESFSIDFNDLEKKLTSDVGAVVIVHIGGIISNNISKIVNLCKQYNVPLIEDAAHAHFSSIDNMTAGSIGEIAAFSFFPTKVMTTGEGGMITTNNKYHYEKIKSLKNFGRSNSNGGLIVNSHGNNFKINEFTALLGCIELDRVKKRIKKRKTLVERYKKNLENTSYKILFGEENNNFSFYKVILITPVDGDLIKQFCKEKNIILTGEVYRIPINEQPLYKNEFLTTHLPNTEYYSKHHICPPLYPELTINEIDYICNILKLALNKYEK